MFLKCSRRAPRICRSRAEGLVMRFISRSLIVLGLLAIAAGSAPAQDRRQNAPGEFDFYVLSLSWSPSFCEAASERGNQGRSQGAQCGGRPFSRSEERRVGKE